jgi:hypothetical protein
MRNLLLLPAVVALVTLAGCYDYAPPPNYVTTYSYSAPSEYYPPPPPPEAGSVVVYSDEWSDDGPPGRYRNW